MVATTFPAVVRVVDLAVGTTVTGLELFEAVQTSGGVGQSVQLTLAQMVAYGGLPTAGNTGQILNKTSASNFSSTWSNITQFVAVGTALATTGSATSIVAFVSNQGITSTQIASGAITSTQIANNAVGTAQLATSIGLTGTLSVLGTASFSGGIVSTGTFNQVGSALVTGTFGVVGTSQFTGSFNVIGTTLFTSNTFGVVGTSLVTGSFGVVGTSQFTGVFDVVGTALFTSGAFGVVGTTQHTGIFNVVGTTLVTGSFGVAGTTLATGLFQIVGSTIVTGTLNVSGTATLTGTILFPAVGSGILKASNTGVVASAVLNTDYIGTNGTANMSTGFVVTVFNAGNATTGTITPSPLNGNYQYIQCNGAFTIAAYTTFDFALDLLIQNGTAPNNITFSGWRVSAATGDTISSTARLTQSAVVATASPGIVTMTAHAANVADPVWFSTSGSLPTGVSSGTIYYISTTTANTFQIATSPGGASLNFSGAQSGTHTGTLPSQFLVSMRSIHFIPTYVIKALQ